MSKRLTEIGSGAVGYPRTAPSTWCIAVSSRLAATVDGPRLKTSIGARQARSRGSSGSDGLWLSLSKLDPNLTQRGNADPMSGMLRV